MQVIKETTVKDAHNLKIQPASLISTICSTFTDKLNDLVDGVKAYSAEISP